MSEASATTLAGDERCTKDETGEFMTYKEAREIAENSVCTKDGKLKDTHWCNSVTGTWWIDTNIVKEECSPTCVINVETKEAEINWMCMGADTEPQIATTRYVATTRYRITTTLATPTTLYVDTDTDESAPLGFNLVYKPDNAPAGASLLGVRDDGFSSQYAGYKFKIEYIVYSSSYGIS